MKKQHWKIDVDGTVCDITYGFSRFGGITVGIDGEQFKLPAGFLGLGAARREIFRVGDEQAVLVVDRRGKAKLLFRSEEQKEI
ncbi:MAG: hypothetical protein IJX74_05485 [Clostridia bacterium]|nr:hypothetical protein [Clostridia bacterium]